MIFETSFINGLMPQDWKFASTVPKQMHNFFGSLHKSFASLCVLLFASCHSVLVVQVPLENLDNAHIALVLVTSANITINDISLKTRFFGLHFCHRKYWCIFNHFCITVMGTESYRIWWNNANGHYAIQGHSRSPILVAVENSYVTSY